MLKQKLFSLCFFMASRSFQKTMLSLCCQVSLFLFFFLQYEKSAFFFLFNLDFLKLMINWSNWVLYKEHVKLKDLALRCLMPANLIDIFFSKVSWALQKIRFNSLLLLMVQAPVLKPWKTIGSKFLQHTRCKAEFWLMLETSCCARWIS